MQRVPGGVRAPDERTVPVPLDESARLQALRSYRVLDTEDEEAFDRITKMASLVLRAPITLVSLLDEERQWFKSRVGLDTRQTPREHAFCAHAIYARQMLLVPDAQADERFANNPLVVGDPHIRSYAGAPLVGSDQQPLGTLCAIDRVPRAFSADEQQVLQDLAAIVVSELELRRRAFEADEHIVTLEKARAEYATLVARHELALKASGIGVWDWDVGNDQLLWDEGMRRIYGTARQKPGQDAEAPYETWLNALHPADRQQSDAQVNAALRGDRELQTEFRIRRPDGATRSLRAMGTVIRDDRGQPERMVGVNWDVTEARERELELERLNEELERFVYFASHDLQAPLRHVASFVDLLRKRIDTQGDPETEKWMNYVYDGAARMKRLLEDLRTYATVERSELQLQRVAMGEIVESVAGFLRAAGAPALEVECGELPVVVASRTQVQQVLQNLLQNAAEYARPDVPARVTIRSAETAEHWVFEVEDNGEGIAPEHHERIFQPFERCSERAAGRTGIGLALCAKVARRHGGDIKVASEVGTGSTFSFSLAKRLASVPPKPSGWAS